MGFTPGNFLPDLIITDPLGTDPKSQGDDHLRNIMKCLIGNGTAGSGSFTPGFTGQYTGTATELNQVNTNLVSFNGRTARAVIPTAGDYDLEGLADVNVASPPTAGDVLYWDGADWINLPGDSVFPQPANLFYTGYGGKVGDRLYLLTQQINNNIATYGTLTNDAIDGWTFEATRDCVVQANADVYYSSSANNQGAALAFGLNVVGSTYPPQGSGRISQGRCWIEASDLNGINTSAAINLSAGDIVSLWEGKGTFLTPLEATLTMAVWPA